ncbi:MAG: UDP-N-acetylenolpyruvoylglucosamine reductase [Parcubacteria group bacterium GW2011_GWA1_44_13]|uniref:UDP-N-acetylenolpyruvoylglucosamine reductase n=1 Tax=Candidatus Nomurabacteria bacterium GW2011_GWB1_44_12 TaxID=1618748 RepID=A0A837IDV2_9BACT|nr:MAG: UDP-N-acetylenolpyruvoylglucosamine reductase [Candidatus Nomurabacteria bacterium GW2011_GWB1_44_12]KKT38384.1 MAG: UDP-N-acetylenolpyruvoylglucosamine reductase [Parcubacteria group bacterium GW2011_GWA1_44_13]HBB44426.1 UDP-N-acetylenolpyruvoylglucosamine reductase [Candidatus Yonathbacteria bacterium]
MSIHIEEQISLAPFTTMRVGGNARFFARVNDVDDLNDAIIFAREKSVPIFILGGGSNTLVSGDGFPGLVIKIEIKGITCEDNRVTASAGEMWDDVVRDAVSRNLWGIENLSLVPGTVGGAVAQNIGAYGVEARETIFSVLAFDTETMQIKTFSRDECEFDYRESFFKKNINLIIVSATFELAQHGTPRADYEDVKKYFEDNEISEPTLSEIRDAIVAIRTKKMPVPPIGTAGSFFKNPVVSAQKYESLKNEFPEIKAYDQGDNTYKLSAAWLIDHVGKWRGARRGDAGVHEKQALILVNYGNASAEEVLSLAREIKNDINEKTGVTLEEEVVMM